MKPLCLLVALALAGQPLTAAARQPPPTERPLSQQREFHGVYLTNFEVGYFIECEIEAGGCVQWVQQEPRWLTGSSREREARFRDCIARWNGSHDRWGLYAISLQGRETLDRQPKYFLHDTERHVLFDDIRALELIGTDETVDQLLPTFRQRARLAC